MKRLLSCLFVVLLLFFLNKHIDTNIYAVSESDCLNKNLSDLNDGEKDECINIILPRIIAAYTPAHEKNKEELAGLRNQLSNLAKRISSIQTQLKESELILFFFLRT